MKRFYWIVRNSQRVGPFGLEALQEKVASGEFTGTDFVFYPGCKGLERLSAVEGISLGGTGLPASMPTPPPVAESRPVTFTAPPEGYNALPPIRQTISLSHPATGGSTQESVSLPVSAQPAPPPRARMPGPGTTSERSSEPAPPPAPRTVAPRLTSLINGAAPAYSGEVATPRIPNLQALQQPASQAPAPEKVRPIAYQADPAPRKPTQLVSRRETVRGKDETERLEPYLPQPVQLPAVPVPADSTAGMDIDFSSIEAALNKPAPTGASVKIPAPIAGARPLASLASVGAEVLAAPEAAAKMPKIMTKRLAVPKQPEPVAEPKPAPLQPAMVFADEMFSKQTLAVNAPAPRPRRPADAAYPQVITKPEPKGVLHEITPELPREVLSSVKYTELARPTEARPVVTPEFTNHLGMGFVQVANMPIGFGLWQVRVRDFRAFSDTAEYDAGPKWRSPDFLQLEDNPVIFVSWLDAVEFCKWLTLMEQEAGWIDADQYYRLPTDEEWSLAVGLSDEPGATPSEKHACAPGIYPWGREWPPPPPRRELCG